MMRQEKSKPWRLSTDIGTLVSLLILGFLALPVKAEVAHPLAACDTSSPRATLESFQRINDIEVHELDRATLRLLEETVRKSMRCLDISRIPRQRIDDDGEAAVILLQEILDRLELPPFEEIPDAKEARENKLTRWVVPDTELEIALVKEGAREGEWLFSPRTVARLKSFYNEVETLPYRQDALWGNKGALGGIYAYITLLPEESMPVSWVFDLPPWTHNLYIEQPVWKWLAMLFVLIVAGVIFALILRISRRADKNTAIHWPKLLPPIGGMVTVLLAEHLIDEYINVAGPTDAITEISMWVIVLAFSTWAILALGGVVSDVIISSPRIQPESIDASLVRITSRLIAFGIAFWWVLEGAEGIGLSLIPLLAGLGVGGLATALAIRPTLENLIGGLVLYIDKPVRIGDRCIFGNQEGFVEKIGLRSTRIRTLGDTLVSIPNAEFSQLQLENISKRKVTRYNTMLNLRYETTAEQLRYVLTKLRELLVGHPMVAPQKLRARFRDFGAHSLDVEINAYFRTDSFDQYWAMREDINLRIIDIVAEAGTSFAFPSFTAYAAEDAGLDAERSRHAEEQVNQWRSEGKLAFPGFDEMQRSVLEDKLDYPPEGSVLKTR